MVVDGASSHKAKELIVPENVRLIPLPGYSPELNPQEHIWDEVTGKRPFPIWSWIGWLRWSNGSETA